MSLILQSRPTHAYIPVSFHIHIICFLGHKLCLDMTFLQHCGDVKSDLIKQLPCSNVVITLCVNWVYPFWDQPWKKNSEPSHIIKAHVLCYILTDFVMHKFLVSNILGVFLVLYLPKIWYLSHDRALTVMSVMLYKPCGIVDHTV